MFEIILHRNQCHQSIYYITCIYIYTYIYRICQRSSDKVQWYTMVLMRSYTATSLHALRAADEKLNPGVKNGVELKSAPQGISRKT